MQYKKILRKLLILLLIPLGLFLVYISSRNPASVESIYSEMLYPPIGRLLSRITGIFPFSLAELIVVCVPVAFVLYTVVFLARLIPERNRRGLMFLKYVTTVSVLVSITFFSFIGIWGLNYYRMPFSRIVGLDVRPASVQELESLCRDLINRANALRASVSADVKGYMDIPGSPRDILKNCYKGYDAIAGQYTGLSGKYGNPKPVLLSRLMNYTGICGVYFPFTGEANVNISIPDSMLPSTATHEMAHQRGFSREDEANYISYLACSHHPDVNYRYSGVLLALIHSMNALYGSDPDSAVKLADGYSEGLRMDLDEINAFWKQYEGPVEDAADKMNNTYLKANNQTDGVKSYGRMVDLLIAEHRKSK